MSYLDEYGQPTDDQMLWWSEANDHADDCDDQAEEDDTPTGPEGWAQDPPGTIVPRMTS